MNRLEEAALAVTAVMSYRALLPRTGVPRWGGGARGLWGGSAGGLRRNPTSAPWHTGRLRSSEIRSTPPRMNTLEASGPARWATRRELRDLVVPGPRPGRVTLGVARRRLIASERGHSVLVVGPTQSGKTSGLAVPAILEWSGPVVAASVKTDLVRHTMGWRTRSGPVAVYDPTASTDLPGASWSPLAASGTWEGARRMAGSLAEVARSSAGTMTDGDFWYATAAKLLAPLLFAAATSRRTMAEVVRWIDTQEVDEVFDALMASGEPAAMQAARASWGRDDRQRSAVYTTAETVVEAFADSTVASSAQQPATIDPEMLLEESGTLYLCAPAHDQRRLRPLFATVVKQVIETAYDRVTRAGTLLDPPLLVVLDEAANVAPLAELDVLASTAAGHGVQLVTVWQDLAQIHSRYGGRGGSVINNHRVKVFLSGIGDTATLDHASTLIGDGETRAVALTQDGYGASSRTDSPVMRRLVPGDALRRLPPGEAVVVSGHLPPVRVTLRPWQHDRALRVRAQPAPNGEAPPSSRRWWWPRVVDTLRL